MALRRICTEPAEIPLRNCNQSNHFIRATSLSVQTENIHLRRPPSIVPIYTQANAAVRNNVAFSKRGFHIYRVPIGGVMLEVILRSIRYRLIDHRRPCSCDF